MYFDTSLKTSRVNLSPLSRLYNLVPVTCHGLGTFLYGFLFGNEKWEMEVTEDTTMGVQIEDVQTPSVRITIALKCWAVSSAVVIRPEGVWTLEMLFGRCRSWLNCGYQCGKVIVIVMDVGFPSRSFLAKSMTVVERNKSHQFNSRADTPDCTPVSRDCENDWRRIMATVLKLLLKKLLLMPPQLLLWVQIHQKQCSNTLCPYYKRTRDGSTIVLHFRMYHQSRVSSRRTHFCFLALPATMPWESTAAGERPVHWCSNVGMAVCHVVGSTRDSCSCAHYTYVRSGTAKSWWYGS